MGQRWRWERGGDDVKEGKGGEGKGGEGKGGEGKGREEEQRRGD